MGLVCALAASVSGRVSLGNCKDLHFAHTLQVLQHLTALIHTLDERRKDPKRL